MFWRRTHDPLKFGRCLRPQGEVFDGEMTAALRGLQAAFATRQAVLTHNIYVLLDSVSALRQLQRASPNLGSSQEWWSNSARDRYRELGINLPRQPTDLSLSRFLSTICSRLDLDMGTSPYTIVASSIPTLTCSVAVAQKRNRT